MFIMTGQIRGSMVWSLSTSSRKIVRWYHFSSDDNVSGFLFCSGDCVSLHGGDDRQINKCFASLKGILKRQPSVLQFKMYLGYFIGVH